MSVSVSPDIVDVSDWARDRFSRIKDVRWWKSGSDLSRVQSGYDRASNRIWRRNSCDTGSHDDWIDSDDGLHRLKHADWGVGSTVNRQ